MYYPEEVVEELRSRVNIVDIVGGYVALKKKGANYFGLCPFHGEKTPSFSVAPGKQIFYCFGCGKGGDVIKFLMEYENITFSEAVVQLAERVGYKLPEQPEDDPGQKRDRDIRDRLLEINKLAGMYYYRMLRSDRGSIGMRYLAKRELRDETIVHWGIGYADQSRDGLYRFLKKRGYSDEILRESGLFSYSERGVYDKFFNRVMFPILDYNNRVIGFGGRVMGDGEPKYLNSPETKLFDKSRNLFGLNFAKRSREKHFILCEGYMDVISMQQAGFGFAVASLGTAFTEQQARLIKRYVNEVLLTYDSDAAGIKAAARALPILRSEGIEARIINLSPYKDPDEFIKAMGNAALQERIDNARNSFLWEVDVLKSGYNLMDPAGQTAYINELGAMLAKRFPQELERENYIKAVAREQMIEPDALRRLVMQRSIEQQGRTDAERYKKITGNRKEKKRPSAMKRSEEQLITWLSEKPELIELVRRHIREEDLSSDTYRRVLHLVYEQTPVNRILDEFRGDDSVYEEVASLFNGNLLSEGTDEYAFKRALEDVIRNIRLNSLNERIALETDAARLTELFKEQSELQNLSL